MTPLQVRPLDAGDTQEREICRTGGDASIAGIGGGVNFGTLTMAA